MDQAAKACEGMQLTVAALAGRWDSSPRLTLADPGVSSLMAYTLTVDYPLMLW